MAAMIQQELLPGQKEQRSAVQRPVRFCHQHQGTQATCFFAWEVSVLSSVRTGKGRQWSQAFWAKYSEILIIYETFWDKATEFKVKESSQWLETQLEF